MTNKNREYYVPTGYRFITNITLYKKIGKTLLSNDTVNNTDDDYQYTVNCLRTLYGDVAVIPAFDICGNDISDNRMCINVGLCVPIQKR